MTKSLGKMYNSVLGQQWSHGASRLQTFVNKVLVSLLLFLQDPLNFYLLLLLLFVCCFICCLLSVVPSFFVDFYLHLLMKLTFLLLSRMQKAKALLRCLLVMSSHWPSVMFSDIFNQKTLGVHCSIALQPFITHIFLTVLLSLNSLHVSNLQAHLTHILTHSQCHCLSNSISLINSGYFSKWQCDYLL